MRLINTLTLDFEEFYGDQIPPYAILSHTWQQGKEVTFQEWLRRDNNDGLVRKKLGFDKIFQTCLLARKDSFDWVWVDTNCIDKTSSAELTEAINSMYEWYSKSAICYAYLSDVSTISPQGNNQELIREFSESRWWTRGWTLQELLAPTRLIFLTGAWEMINDRASLAIRIERLSGISQGFLNGTLSPQMADAGQKMSWLSKRGTTRVEDMAYCMLGLFGINMPLLYGEGRKAFWRLQEEIIRVSNDHTIFCWTWTDTVPTTWVSMLAPWPDTFVDSWQFMSVSPPRGRATLMPIPYTMTNVGLSIQMPVIHTLHSWFVCLNVTLRRGVTGVYASVRIARHKIGLGLRRCWFPTTPILLIRDTADRNDKLQERLHNLIIESRSAGSENPRSMGHGYKVLLFLQPRVTEYMCRGPSTQLLQHLVVDSAPYGASFDRETGLFGLARLSRYIYAGRFVIVPENHKDPVNEVTGGISLFFAVTGATTETEGWHCSVKYCEGTHWYDDGIFLGHTNPDIRKDYDEKGIMSMCRWLSGCRQVPFMWSNIKNVSYTDDELIQLGIGDTLTLGSGMVVRSAYLSNKRSFKFPVPFKDEFIHVS